MPKSASVLTIATPSVDCTVDNAEDCPVGQIDLDDVDPDRVRRQHFDRPIAVLFT